MVEFDYLINHNGLLPHALNSAKDEGKGGKLVEFNSSAMIILSVIKGCLLLILRCKVWRGAKRGGGGGGGRNWSSLTDIL